VRGKLVGGLFLVGMLLVGAAPIFYLMLAHGVSFHWFLIGAGAWAFGVALKVPLAFWERSAQRRFRPENAPPLLHSSYALLSGLGSGLAELGAAFLVLLYLMFPGRLAELIAFGVGAGSAEVLYLLLVAMPQEVKRVLEPGSLRQETPKAPPSVALWAVLERAYATVMHTTTRGLVALSIVRVNPLPGLLGLLIFTLLDGAAFYGDLRGWNWHTHRVLLWFHAFGLGITALGVLLFWAFL
jgi:hypothetical protein